MAALAVFAVRIEAHEGYPARWPARVVQLSDYMDPGIHPDRGRWGVCATHGESPSGLRWPGLSFDPQHIPPETCLPFTPGRHHYLLVGDSHSAFLWSGLSRVFPELEIGQADATSCGVYGDSLYSKDPTCAGVDHMIYDDLVPNHKVDTILMSYYWNQDLLHRVSRVVAYARQYGVDVIVVGPTDVFVVSLPRVLAVASLDPSKPVHANVVPWMRPLEPIMRNMARDVWKVKYISFYDDMCGPKVDCPVYTPDGAPLYWDTHHLSDEGSLAFAQSIQAHHQLP